MPHAHGGSGSRFTGVDEYLTVLDDFLDELTSRA
jgi:hypothetical protein